MKLESAAMKFTRSQAVGIVTLAVILLLIAWWRYLWPILSSP